MGSFSLDNDYWGKPETMNLSRPVGFVTRSSPGSDLLGGTAAALAASAMVFAASDPSYAQGLTELAIQLHSCALTACMRHGHLQPTPLPCMSPAAACCELACPCGILKGDWCIDGDARCKVTASVHIIYPTGCHSSGCHIMCTAPQDKFAYQTGQRLGPLCVDQAHGLLHREGAANLGYYSRSVNDSAILFNSSSYFDDLAWGAVWLYKRTGDSAYLAAAQRYHAAQLPYLNRADPGRSTVFNWDNVMPGVSYLLLEASGFRNTSYQYMVRAYPSSQLHALSPTPPATLHHAQHHKGGDAFQARGLTFVCESVVNAVPQQHDDIAGFSSCFQLVVSSTPDWACISLICLSKPATAFPWDLLDEPAPLQVEDFVHSWARYDNGISKTPKYASWVSPNGALAEAANAGLIAWVYGTNAAPTGFYKCWAEYQMRYILGDGRRSFMVGHGANPPRKPQHKGASCSGEGPLCSQTLFMCMLRALWQTAGHLHARNFPLNEPLSA